VRAGRRDGVTADESEDEGLPPTEDEVEEQDGEQIDESESEAAPAAID
jgi:hypothetical protein